MCSSDILKAFVKLEESQDSFSPVCGMHMMSKRVSRSRNVFGTGLFFWNRLGTGTASGREGQPCATGRGRAGPGTGRASILKKVAGPRAGPDLG